MQFFLLLGLSLVGMGSAFHLLIVRRISEAHQTSFLKLLLSSGSLDFRHYFSARKRYGWSAAPFWLTALLWLSGSTVILIALAKG